MHNPAQNRFEFKARKPAVIFAAALFLIVLSYFFADREVASALRPHLTGVRPFIWLTYIATPLTPLASILIVAAGVRALMRHPLTALDSAVLRIASAILIAGILTHELKEVFGRTWPETWINNNPSYFGNGAYGFFPFHGGGGYASFPSGHTTVVSAFAAALWFMWPSVRWIGIAAVLAVAAGLLGADYHWLSDIIAGGTVGGFTGWAAATIGRPSRGHH